jgi:hypothetical protein
LTSGMRSGYSFLDSSNGSPWRLPIPNLDQDTISEMREKRVNIDGTIGVRRAIAAGGDALEQLIDFILSLEGACTLVAGALAADVHNCAKDSMASYIMKAHDRDETRQNAADISILTKRMDKRDAAPVKKVAFTEVNATKAAEENEEEEPPDHFDTDSAAFLNAIQDSLMLPSERPGKHAAAAILDDDDGTPSVLVGRTRRPPKPGRTYGPEAITMLDNLREMYSSSQPSKS